MILLEYLTGVNVKHSGGIPLHYQAILNESLGNSLGVQWLGLPTFTSKGLSLIPGWGIKIP